MRVIINKGTSTKPERIFFEILKKNHIPFQYHVKMEGHEIDFIIGYYAVEINGHRQSSRRNDWLFNRGYTPIHYTNSALLKNPKTVEENIVSKYGFSTQNSEYCPLRRSV